MAAAPARLLVTLPILAETSVLTVWTPAVVVAGALPRHIVTLAIREAGALALAVWTPELAGAFGVTTGSKISMATTAFIWPDTHLVLLAGEVALTQRSQTLIPCWTPAPTAYHFC